MEAVLNEPETKKGTWGPAALEQRRERSRNHLARIALRREGWIDRNEYYYELLNRLLRFLVEPQKRVLSVRCGTGNLLTVVQPAEGKGIDICPEIVEIAQQRNPSLEFAVAFPDKEEFRTVFKPEEKFDYILFNDIGDTVDVLQALRNLKRLCMTQVVIGRLLPPPVPKEELSVSVIVPCKNERVNVEDAVQRMPQLGRQTEIIFCDDQSTDGTAEEVLRVQSLYSDKDIR